MQLQQQREILEEERKKSRILFFDVFICSLVLLGSIHTVGVGVGVVVVEYIVLLKPASWPS